MNLIGHDYKSFTRNNVLGYIQTTNLPVPVPDGKVCKVWFSIESVYESKSYFIILHDLHYPTKSENPGSVNRRIKCAFQIRTKWTGYKPNINTKRFQGELASALYRAVNDFCGAKKKQPHHITRDAVIDDIRLYDVDIPCRYCREGKISCEGSSTIKSIFYNQNKDVESFMYEVYDTSTDDTLYLHPGEVHIDVDGRKLICPKRNKIQEK